MQRYITHAVGILFILCMLLPFAYTTDSESYSVSLVSGWRYFSQNLFSLSSILIFLAFFFINYQADKNIQLIIFIMTFMVFLLLTHSGSRRRILESYNRIACCLLHLWFTYDCWSWIKSKTFGIWLIA